MQEILEDKYGAEVAAATAARRGGGVPERRVRRAFGEAEPAGARRTRRGGFGSGFRLTFRAGVVPQSTRGRVVAGVALLVGLGALAAVVYGGQTYLLHDERFVIPASSSIQVEGNSHVSRAQMLSVFGEDVDRNIFRVPLEERRSQLETMPWVEHATVMRLLPDRLRVAVVERTPVAYVRQGKRIGLVDGSGVLLDMPAAGEDRAAEHYSFPVVTGVTEQEPRSVRAARMKIFERFRADLDSSKEDISGRLSEVDLSNPEDVKALIPAGETEILVHFGDGSFLERYRKFEEELPGWRTQYPKLASADMRYERQVVLEMQPGTAVPLAKAEGAAAAKHAPEKKAAAAVKRPVSSGKGLSGVGKPHFPEDLGKRGVFSKVGKP